MPPKTRSKSSKRSTHSDPEQSKAKRDASGDDLLHNSIKTEEKSPTSPTLLAWSSRLNNKIRIVESESKQEFANFDGVKINYVNELYNWTHVKEIADKGLLVSVNHGSQNAANLQVFDVSRKGQARKIYSFEELSGNTGYGDVTYNTRRCFLGAIPVSGKIAYHLYNVTTGKTGNIVKLIRKSKWHSQYDTEGGNCTTSLDFNPNGEAVVTVDRDGTCLLSDVSTHSYRFHMKLEKNHIYDPCGRCRWSTNPDEPLLFVKFYWSKLYILDVEKQALSLKNPIKLEEGHAYWIDVCPSNGNLLASGGMQSNVRIFDKRESKIVQTFKHTHKNPINCVRWSPSGEMLANSSWDNTVALLDFKTGKNLYTGKTPDDKAAMSICFI